MLTTVEKVMRLQSVDVFADVPSELLAELAAIADEVDYSSGEVVFAEGEEPDAVYVVLDGVVSMERADAPSIEVAADGAFGVWAILGSWPRMFTARSRTECHLLRIHHQDLAEFVSDHTQVAAVVLTALAARLRSALLGSGTNGPSWPP